MSFPINQTFVDFLQISQREVKVLRFLKDHPHSQVSDMAKNIGMPRMTIYSSLKTLKRRGLIHYETKGKRRLWHIVSEKILKEILLNVVQTIID